MRKLQNNEKDTFKIFPLYFARLHVSLSPYRLSPIPQSVGLESAQIHSDNFRGWVVYRRTACQQGKDMIPPLSWAHWGLFLMRRLLVSQGRGGHCSSKCKLPFSDIRVLPEACSPARNYNSQLPLQLSEVMWLVFPSCVWAKVICVSLRQRG